MTYRFLLRLLASAVAVSSVDAATDTAFAVQASASVQVSPAQITLSWTPGPGPTGNYAVSRKDPTASTWTPLITLAGNVTQYADTAVSPGRVYEYQIVREAPGITGYGYVAAGIDVPATDARGRIILVIDSSVGPPLTGEIDQLVRDLRGSGWLVTRRDVGRGDLPTAVRETIRSAYREDPTATRAVFLLGHVPVAKSGMLNIDGHAARPLPTDAFYGDLDGVWTDANGDGVFDHDTLPSDVELAVGRVDFADLPSLGNELDLLKRYLAKDHDFRRGARRISLRALVGDRLGDFGGEAFGASGFRNFAALVGPGRLTAANVEDNSPPGERWLSQLTANDWLWVYGGGGGDVTTISGLGFRGEFGDVGSADLVNQRARGTFYLLFGSWLVDWSQPDNIMRAALAAPDYGLTAAWSGRPHLFFHRMAMGETAGDAIRLSQNNATLYANQVNRGTRGIHIALLGDPTLTMQVVSPPTDLSVTGGQGQATLSWTASPDADAGYYVYRAANEAEPFTRVTPTAVSGTRFTDNSAPAGASVYRVRAVHRETSGSGTYLNLSEGTEASVTVTAPAPSPPISAAPATTAPVSPAPAASTPVTPASEATTATPTPTSGSLAKTAPPAGGGGAPSLWMLAALALLVGGRHWQKPR